MWTVINGFDYTSYIPHDSISVHQALNDPQPNCNFDVVDPGAQLSIDTNQEVILFDEAAPPTYTFGGRAVPTIPAHNCLIGFPNTSPWVASGSLSSLITQAVTPVMTFNNNALGTGTYYQITPSGYIHPGQQYMFSMYFTISTPLTNATALLQLDFLDASQSVIAGATVTLTTSSTVGNAEQQLNISGVAPSGAYFAKVSFGGSTTVNGSNSGSIVFGSPQLEPMWFASRGISYPTPDNNRAQVASAQMPDGTFSRQCRVFAGFIDDLQISYEGSTRIWHISCAGPGALLENAEINAVYSQQYDDQIITSIVNTYFAGQISISPPNTSSPSPVQRGALIDSASYSDNTMREVLNGLSDTSGYSSVLDWYYILRYNPAYYAAANFTLTDGIADNVTSFNYYDYTLERDATQRKRRIKVIGGKFIAPAISDTFNGDGTTKTFTLSQQPFNVQSVTVNGTAQKVGVSGRDTLGSNGIVALVDKANKTLTFQSAPASGTGNVIITYTYEAPVVVQVTDQSGDVPIAPAYALPSYDAKVNDTNLISLAACTQRGLAELSKQSQAKTIITLKTSQYASAGTIIYFTSSLDGITTQPFIVQTVDASYLGNGINEFSYQLGAYQPTLTDHIRNANKALNRSKTTAYIRTPLQYDVVAYETMVYRDSISATVQTVYAAGVYGTGVYGSCAYGGMTGTYGGTAQYGRSTIYG